MNQLNHPHDAFFKQLLSKPEVARDFLTQHLPAEVLALIDLATLETILLHDFIYRLETHLAAFLSRQAVSTASSQP